MEKSKNYFIKSDRVIDHRITLFRSAIFFSILLGSCFVFGVGKASAATYYVWENGQSGQAACAASVVCYSTTGFTDNSPSGVADLEAVVELAGVTTGTVIVVSGGPVGGDGIIYTATEIDSDSALGIDEKVAYFGGVRPTDAGYANHGGTVTIDNNEVGAVGTGIVRPEVHCDSVGSCIIGRLTVKNSSSSYGIYTSGNNWQFDDIVSTAVQRGFGIIGATGCVLNRPLIYETQYPIYSTSSYTMNYGLIHSNTSIVWINGGNPTINNSTFVGNRYEAFNTSGTASPTINNSMFTANCLSDNTKYPILDNATGEITCNNCLVTPNPGSLTKIYGGTVNFNSSMNSSPLFVKNRRPAIIVFGSDDRGNLDYFKDIMASKLDAYGWKGSFALSDPYAVTGSDWTKLINLVSEGHSITVHGDSYCNQMTSRTGLSMTYSGAATAADCAVTDSGGDYATRFSCVNDAATVIDLDLTSLSSNTLDKVVAVVNAGTGTHGYTASKRNTDGCNAVYSKYLTTQSQNVKAGAKNYDLNGTRVFDGELRDTKSYIETNIPGYAADTFVHPGNASDSTIRDALLSLGFSGARGSGTESSYSLENLNIFNITPGSLYNVFGSDTDPQNTSGKIEQYMGSIIDYLSYVGGIHFYYAHNSAEFTSDAWDALLAYVEKHGGAQVMSLSEAITYIKANGVDSGDHLTYTRTMVNDPDYHLQSDSPAIDAGTDVSLTTDFEGNPVYGPPDIGGYEFQPTHNMAAATPDDPQIGETIRVYGNAKFRNTVDDSEENETDTAKLSIVPQDSETTEWIDLDISTWNTSGTHQKTWTENGDNIDPSTQTLHTVGDLVSGQSYTIKIDTVQATDDNLTGEDCDDGACTANENGEIIFTYTGGYSEHTFDIEDETAPVITITSPEIPESGDTVSGDDTITFTDTEQTDPECSIDNTNWTNCISIVTSFDDLTGWDDIEESDTFTLYMRDTDGAGNTGTTSVANLTKADTQAPIRSNGSPSGELSSGTTETSIGLTTNESAVCKYSTSSSTAYGSMTDVFANVDGTAHSATVSGLSSGNTYNYYVRCQDDSENANDTDYLISFSVANEEDNDDNDNEENNERDLNTSKIKVTSTQDSITIEWKTDHKTKSTVRYGTNRNLNEKKKDNDKEKKHKMTIDNLLPDTKYYFKIKSEDGDDNEDKSRIHSIKTKPVVSSKTADQDSNANQDPQEAAATSQYSGTATPKICSYTVEEGDTLWNIANEVYGTPTAYPQIVEKNKDKYPNIASVLSIGQELTFDCQNSGDVQETSDVKEDNKSETQPMQNQNQESTEAREAKWWNPFSWF